MSTAVAPLDIAFPTRRRATRAASFGLFSLIAFSAAAVGAGLGRAVVTTYLPVLLERIQAAPGLIGMVLLVNAVAGFAVPLGVGVWGDRLRARGRGRSMPLILGGALLTAGGLLAIGLGNATTYLTLTAFALVAYVGLNAVTTAHRAFVPESFAPEGRARATGAQELAILVGGLLGVAVGGVLISSSALLLFVLAALLLPLLALPTVIRMRGRETFVAADEGRTRRGRAYYLQALRTPGVAALLGAQLLWVLGYAALPAFFILYAENVLGLTPAVAGLWLVGFGVVTGATLLTAGRARRVGRHRTLLAVGVALMGIGFLAVAASTSLAVVGVGLLGAAIGFGVVSTIGFPLFSGLIPEGETGGYTAMYFSVRAVASAIALPAAGWMIAFTGSYRSLFMLGGIATVGALVPLARVPGPAMTRPRALAGLHRPRASRLARLAAVAVGAVAAGAVAATALGHTALGRADQALFSAVNALGPWPDAAFDALNPHLRNYALLSLIALVATLVTRRRLIPVAALVLGAWALAYTLSTAVTVLVDRPRPEEVASSGVFEGVWAPFASFPSGHAAVTAALTISIAALFPRLRLPMLAYLAVVATSRVAFGAHFPLDVLGGVAIGYAAVFVVGVALVETGLLAERPRLTRRAPASRAASPAPAGTS